MLDYDRYRENLVIEADKKDARILRVSLNNPEKLNANTNHMHWSLSRIWDDIDADDDVHLVVFSGVGDRAFSAGGDPQHMLEMADEYALWWKTVREAKRIIYNMLECDVPLIARLNGHAVGLGATLALASDIIIGVEDARFGDPHVHAGLVCGDGGALLWPQQIGYARAKELLFTGELLSMSEAAEIGLINYAVPREELDAKVDAIAHKIVNGASRAIRLTKNLMNVPLRQAAHATMDLGMANETLSTMAADHREAIASMLEKRKPVFDGQ